MSACRVAGCGRESDCWEHTYSTKWVAHLTGASLRQLDYWSTRGVVGPKGNGSGTRRRWSRGEVATVAVLVRLSNVAGAKSRGAVPWLDRASMSAAARCLADVGHPDHGWLVVHRDRAVFVPIEKALASTIRSVGAALVVDLRETAAAAVASSDDPSPRGRSAAGEATGVAAPTVPVPGRRVVADQHRPPDPRQIAGGGDDPVSQKERAAAIGAVTPAAAR